MVFSLILHILVDGFRLLSPVRHLMMQTTLFIGCVDFYWTDRHGVRQRRAMDTGDSNYISPFVPHSFTKRKADEEAIIIAAPRRHLQDLLFYEVLGHSSMGCP